jgi:hypothetical protein
MLLPMFACVIIPGTNYCLRCPAVPAVFCVDLLMQQARTIEELVMQRFERERTQQYFLHVKGVFMEASRVRQEAADELHASVAGSMPQVNLAGSTAAVKHVLQEAAVHGALAVLLERSAAKHQAWFDAAAAAFEGLSV